MVDQAEQPAEEQAGEKKELVVTVHNEDAGGDPIEITGHPHTLVREIVKKLYKDLGVERQEGDRLYCLENGSDVFSHEEQRLEEYAKRECGALEWGFSSPTGGV